MCLGGVFVLVFVSSLTVVQSLLMLLTSGLIFSVFIVLLLFVLLVLELPLLLLFVSYLFLTVSFCE